MRSSPTPAQARLYADIRRLLSTLMRRDIADPRLEGVVVTRIEPFHGGHRVRVWVHRVEVEDADDCIARLNRLAPHFARELRRALPRRRIPVLEFHWDASIEAGSDMVRLLSMLEGDSP